MGWRAQLKIWGAQTNTPHPLPTATAQGSRTILLGSYNRLGQNLGVLFAWLGACVLLLLVEVVRSRVALARQAAAVAPAAAALAPAGPNDEEAGGATANAAPARAGADVKLWAGSEEFAVVESVSVGSPAHAAGLRQLDRILSVGSATRGDELGALIAASVDQPLRVVLLRGGEYRTLTLVPRPWEGAGLLGCRFLLL